VVREEDDMGMAKTIRAPSGTIRERIRIARDRAELTRAELGRRVGVRPSAARQWESRGATTPRIDHLAKIATVTGVAFEWMATGRGPMALPNGEEQAVIVVEVFARDADEERLLTAFRRINPRHREPVVKLVEGLTR
jgi:transcriptional regulator with XRE-family HTH domain